MTISDEGAHGPTQPSPEVRAELEGVLQQDQSALGDVWRRTRAGERPEDIQAARGTDRPNFVWNYNRIAKAVLEGDLPTAPTVAAGAASTFRRLLRAPGLTLETRDYLESCLADLTGRVNDREARDEEDARALAVTTTAERAATPGIYVYALPHYLRHPYDASSNRTLMKVGRSDRSVIQRFTEQTRTTALPEEPVLLRVYPATEDLPSKERYFHNFLESADHDRSTARTGGTEWFLTSLKFLDQVATSAGLEIVRVFEPGSLLD